MQGYHECEFLMSEHRLLSWYRLWAGKSMAHVLVVEDTYVVLVELQAVFAPGDYVLREVVEMDMWSYPCFVLIKVGGQRF